MNDLRYDPDTVTVTTPAGTAQALRLEPDALRTVPMPDLRSAEARTLDAKARDLTPFPARVDAELEALRLCVQELRQAVGDLQRTVAALKRRA